MWWFVVVAFEGYFNIGLLSAKKMEWMIQFIFRAGDFTGEFREYHFLHVAIQLLLGGETEVLRRTCSAIFS
jgi:hypothetical protein